MNTMTVPISTLRALKSALATDNTRPVLRYVWYCNGRLAAGDGFVLLAIDAPGELPNDTLIDANAILSAAQRVRTMRNAKTPPVAEIAMQEDGTQAVTISAGWEPGARTVVLPSASHTPPDEKGVRRVLATPGKGAIAVTLNAGLLKRIAEAALSQKTDDSAITFTIPKEPDSAIPFAFRGQHQELFEGVVMPMHSTVKVTKK